MPYGTVRRTICSTSCAELLRDDTRCIYIYICMYMYTHIQYDIHDVLIHLCPRTRHVESVEHENRDGIH